MLTSADAPRDRSDSSVRIILDHPERHRLRRLWRTITTVVGALLVLIGLTASIPAVPSALAVVSFVLGWLTEDRADPNAWPTPDVPVFEIVLLAAVTVPIAIAGIRVGLRLLRRHRTLVLFLRRFRHDEAQYAVTFAVLRTIGASWRIVTLDDAEMAPIGVPAGTRRLFTAGRLTSTYGVGFGQAIAQKVFPFVIMAMWGILAIAVAGPAIELARTGVTTWSVWGDALEPYLRIVESVFKWQLPFDRIAPSLPGLFALLACVAAVSFVVMIAWMALLILAFPFSTVLFFLSASADGVREAERAKASAIDPNDDIRWEATTIARRSRKVFGPRLVVVRVPTPRWQEAVLELARVSSLPLIDISDPTEHVIWEVEELGKRFGDRCVLIGHYDRVVALEREASTGDPSDVTARLRTLLAGRVVLAYTTDRPGLKRFANALRGLLLTNS